MLKQHVRRILVRFAVMFLVTGRVNVGEGRMEKTTVS